MGCRFFSEVSPYHSTEVAVRGELHHCVWACWTKEDGFCCTCVPQMNSLIGWSLNIRDESSSLTAKSALPSFGKQKQAWKNNSLSSKRETSNPTKQKQSQQSWAPTACLYKGLFNSIFFCTVISNSTQPAKFILVLNALKQGYL